MMLTKTRKNKGFTLIELITVMVILGVLAAYAVPKLFDFTDTAKSKTRDQFRVEINSALRMYGLQELASTGEKSYPPNNSFTLADLIEESSDELGFSAGSGADPDTFLYDGNSNSVFTDAGTDYYMTYDTTGSSYTLGTWTVR